MLIIVNQTKNVQGEITLVDAKSYYKTELQLRKPETIGEVFNVARKVALTEGSAQGSHYRKKERYIETSP